MTITQRFNSLLFGSFLCLVCLAGLFIVDRGQVSDQELGRALGADAYFVKPFSPLALARHLATALLPATKAVAG